MPSAYTMVHARPLRVVRNNAMNQGTSPRLPAKPAVHAAIATTSRCLALPWRHTHRTAVRAAWQAPLTTGSGRRHFWPSTAEVPLPLAAEQPWNRGGDGSVRPMLGLRMAVGGGGLHHFSAQAPRLSW